jgi:hypothetical protein
MHHAYSQEGQLKRLDRSVPCCECRFGVLEQSIQSERGERGGQVPRDEREREGPEREKARETWRLSRGPEIRVAIKQTIQVKNPSPYPFTLVPFALG